VSVQLFDRQVTTVRTVESFANGGNGWRCCATDEGHNKSKTNKQHGFLVNEMKMGGWNGIKVKMQRKSRLVNHRNHSIGLSVKKKEKNMSFEKHADTSAPINFSTKIKLRKNTTTMTLQFDSPHLPLLLFTIRLSPHHHHPPHHHHHRYHCHPTFLKQSSATMHPADHTSTALP
jgi:hypothetical protein